MKLVDIPIILKILKFIKNGICSSCPKKNYSVRFLIRNGEYKIFANITFDYNEDDYSNWVRISKITKPTNEEFEFSNGLIIMIFPIMYSKVKKNTFRINYDFLVFYSEDFTYLKNSTKALLNFLDEYK